MTTVLLTRPLEQSQALTRQLARYDIQTAIAPMLQIESMVAAIPPMAHTQALVFSSQHAVNMFDKRCRETGISADDKPVFCVGEATSAAADRVGFKTIHNANGDAADLKRLVLDKTRPDKGTIVHVRGADVASSIADELLEYGYRTENMVIYSARTSDGIGDDIINQMYTGEIAHVMFFSPRTAQTFVSLARSQGFAVAMPQMTAICMSENVADALRTGVHWRFVRVASTPREDAMIDCLRETLKL
jgi:uroporphyrinogen-III synthase